VAQFADGHAAEREFMGFSETLEPFDRLDDLSRRRRRPRAVRCNGTLGGILKQTGSIRIKTSVHALRLGERVPPEAPVQVQS
jgi:hypothetical protein